MIDKDKEEENEVRTHESKDIQNSSYVSKEDVENEEDLNNIDRSTDDDSTTTDVLKEIEISNETSTTGVVNSLETE